ncbi:DUF554 domain-containing protein [filamentous cyanobacterium LEGE 11480]|uniref:DUF554 domain-containing protein n=2 Tax=Romeriopsis TaxID=2992131 RepID=A0A928VM27_9CYAN|nr:DUF554 domain-containing protein [Romeriopsis navalis LEGE 11480]
MPLVATSIAPLDFWAKTSGTWLNVLTVLVGTSIGLLCRNRFPPTFQQVITQGVGLCVIFLGLTMAGSLLKVQVGRADGLILGLLALVLGGLLGETLQLEMRLQQLGDWLKGKFRGGDRFTEGFVATTLLFCVGPMAIVGCLNNGLAGNDDLLTVKAIMDGLSSIAFSSIYGVGVGFSVGPILIYQGCLSLAAGILSTTLVDPARDPRVLLVAGVGGLMVLGIGINLLEIQKIRVSSFLPALAIAPVIFWVATLIG